jgi:hypothetical protein
VSVDESAEADRIEAERQTDVARELLACEPTAEQVQRARKYLDRFPSTTEALTALARACAELNEDNDPAWARVTEAVAAALPSVAQAEAAAL